MSTYITAVAAGPYHAVRPSTTASRWASTAASRWPQYLDPDEIFEVTRQGFDFFHGAFGVRYPFGKYDQLFVPEYKAGAMENAGCVTFLEDYVFRSRVTDFAREARAETILHEMAHMWFGDLVTMRWWDDLWLNESFATWARCHRAGRGHPLDHAPGPRSRSCTRPGPTGRTSCPPPTRSRPTSPTSRRSRSTSTGSPTPRARPCSSSSSPTSAGTTSWPACARYFGQHAWGNATLGDLLAALEETSGRDLAGWSKQWLETAGVNTLRPEFELDAEGRFTEFAVLQEAAADHPVLRAAPDRDRALRPDRRRAWSAGAGWRPTSPASAPCP